MSLKEWNDRQLRFDLDLDEIDEDAQERAISPMDARQISEAARQAFDELRNGSRDAEGRGWFEDYLRLIELGWPWRVATYIAWAASPKHDRWPGSVQELAEKVLGLTGPRMIYAWRKKYPAIDATVAMLQAAPLFEHRRDVIEALVASATDPDYKHHPDRKLLLEMIGDYVPRSQIDIGKKASGDVSEYSDAELEAMLGGSMSAGDRAESGEEEDDGGQ